MDRVTQLVEAAKAIGCFKRPNGWDAPCKPEMADRRRVNALAFEKRRLARLSMEFDRAAALASEYAAWLRERPDFTCSYCANLIPHTVRNRQIDHIKPLSRGGRHTVYNVVPVCRRCNVRKRTSDPVVPPYIKPTLSWMYWYERR